MTALARHFETGEPRKSSLRQDRRRAKLPRRLGNATAGLFRDARSRAPRGAAQGRGHRAPAPRRRREHGRPAASPKIVSFAASRIFAGGYAAGYYSYKWARC